MILIALPSFDPLFHLLHRFPARFKKGIGDRVAVSRIRAKTLVKVCEYLGILADLHSQFNTPAHQCSCFKYMFAEVCGKLAELNSLTDQLNFLQLTDEALVLNRTLFACTSRHDIEAADCSLCHIYEVLGGDSGVPFGGSFRTACNPNRDADCGNCPNRLNPGCGCGGRQRTSHISNSKSDVQKSKNREEGYETENDPVIEVEILAHDEPTLDIDVSCGLIVRHRKPPSFEEQR